MSRISKYNIRYGLLEASNMDISSTRILKFKQVNLLINKYRQGNKVKICRTLSNTEKFLQTNQLIAVIIFFDFKFLDSSNPSELHK